MGIREKFKQSSPVLIIIIYMVYFYITCTLQYKNGWLIPLKNVSISNLGIILFSDFTNMLILPLILLILYRKNLSELGLKKSKLSIVLLLIYVLFFVLKRDYTVKGVYNAFFYLFIVALPEEIIYRGYLYSNLKKYNRTMAIIISGILFGMIHSILPSVVSESSVFAMIMDMPNQLFGGIMGSLMFIYCWELSGSIWVSVLIHALLDYSYQLWGIGIAVIVLGFLLISNQNSKKNANINS